MKKIFFLSIILSFLSCKPQPPETTENIKTNKNQKVSIASSNELFFYQKIEDIPTPAGFVRIEVDSNSFGYFLRNLPLKEDNTVYYYNGEPKHTQENHFAVVDIDVGDRNLQQCADAVMRLRAEYLFSKQRYNEIHFNFSDGKPRYYKDYSGQNRSYDKFRKYMDYVFTYANSASLKQELESVKMEDMQIGDVLLRMGSTYGHAISIVDMAINSKTGKKIFMITQSYMPAQSIHILKNFNDKNLSPWYSLEFGETLYTPEWTFTKNDLKRFKK